MEKFTNLATIARFPIPALNLSQSGASNLKRTNRGLRPNLWRLEDFLTFFVHNNSYWKKCDLWSVNCLHILWRINAFWRKRCRIMLRPWIAPGSGRSKRSRIDRAVSNLSAFEGTNREGMMGRGLPSCVFSIKKKQIERFIDAETPNRTFERVVCVSLRERLNDA